MTEIPGVEGFAESFAVMIEKFHSTPHASAWKLSYNHGTMRLYTNQECEEWLRDRKRLKPDTIPGNNLRRIIYPRETLSRLLPRPLRLRHR